MDAFPQVDSYAPAPVAPTHPGTGSRGRSTSHEDAVYVRTLKTEMRKTESSRASALNELTEMLQGTVGPFEPEMVSHYKTLLGS